MILHFSAACRVAAGVLAEVARYQAETRADFQQLMTEFVAVQVRSYFVSWPARRILLFFYRPSRCVCSTQ